MPGALRRAGLSRRTVHQAFSTLRTALFQAIVDSKISANQCQRARVPGPGRSKAGAWEVEHVEAFLAYARQAEPRLAPAFQLAAWRGLRRGEIIGLKWADVDLDAGLLRIERNATEAARRTHVNDPKTEANIRIVSLGPKLVTVLRAHHKAQAADRLAAGPDWADEGWVFPRKDGRMLAPHTLTHRFRALARKLPELPEAHFHLLRHTAATHMLAAGVAPKVVQDQIGYAHISMTLDLYGHVLERQRDASADAVEALYSDPVTPL